MSIALFKTLHIIGFVAWFAGLFYLVRIFVYYREAADKPEMERRILQDQYHLMQQRVYKIICNPAMMITWLAGLMMLYLYGWEWFKLNTWIHTKILLVILLTVYHLYCKRYIKHLREGTGRLNSFQLRLANEVPTLFLFAIVIFAVYRNVANAAVVFGSTILFGVILFIFTKWYKKIRESKAEN